MWRDKSSSLEQTSIERYRQRHSRSQAIRSMDYLNTRLEDELILLGQIGANAAIFTGLYWPALGPVGASLAILEGTIPLYVTVGSLVGKLHHRLLNDEEWEMARYIFRDSLYDRDEIILTNLGG